MSDLDQVARHFGDPCVYCSVGHDDVQPGPCAANDGALHVVGYAVIEIRWDCIAHYRWRASDGVIHDGHSHVTNRLPYYHFGLREHFGSPPPHDLSLKQPPAAIRHTPIEEKL